MMNHLGKDVVRERKKVLPRRINDTEYHGRRLVE